MKKMATMPNALPLSKPATYTGLETTERWDQDRIYGCVCDSSWPVGLGPGQRQEPEWFGPWCSLRHCPSGDDPYTTHVDETNCTGKVAAGGYGVVTMPFSVREGINIFLDGFVPTENLRFREVPRIANSALPDR